MTGKQRKELLKAQQGELDAVLMYNALADKVKLQKDKNTFCPFLLLAPIFRPDFWR